MQLRALLGDRVERRHDIRQRCALPAVSHAMKLVANELGLRETSKMISSQFRELLGVDRMLTERLPNRLVLHEVVDPLPDDRRRQPVGLHPRSQIPRVTARSSSVSSIRYGLRLGIRTPTPPGQAATDASQCPDA